MCTTVEREGSSPGQNFYSAYPTFSGNAEAVTGHAGALTPVPGGVGPVTTALLLLNTVTAAAREAG